jgi:ABC-type molybdate transport system permease subunit
VTSPRAAHFALLSWLALAAALPLGGCARARGGRRAARPIAVHVRNDVIPPSELSVYLVSESGGRQFLGSVPPSQTRTLMFRQAAILERYQLIAEPPLARAIRSQPFMVDRNVAGVSWELGLNSLLLIQPPS